MVKYITRHGPIPGPGPGPGACNTGLKDLHVSTLPDGVISGSGRKSRGPPLVLLLLHVVVGG